MFPALRLLLAALPLVAAWPGVMEANDRLQKAVEPEPREPLFKTGRPNTSLPSFLGFSAAEQFVDVRPGSGHEFKSAGVRDKRGPCPGLNSAANHGFIPRNGLVNILQVTTGLGEAFNFSPDFSLFLATIAIAFAGDPLTNTFSIGGSFPSSMPLLFDRPSGSAGLHNQFEGDASMMRGDAYLNGGDVEVFQMRSWEHFYNMGEEYTLDMTAAQTDYVTRWSILNNPYYFSAPLSGLIVPAAQNLVVNYFSNHSAERPNGFLNRDVLKSFFAITGEPGSFVHHKGQERIPENWYKRPTLNIYDLPAVTADTLINNAMYPGILRLGGNTGKVNSFAGVDITDITGGAFNLADLAEGNNGACFFLQTSMSALPDAANPLLGIVRSVRGWASQQLSPLMSKLGCGELAAFDNALFDKYPGARYKAKGQ